MSKEIVLEVRDDSSEKCYFSHVFLLISSLWFLSLNIYILNVAALDETIIPSCLHFSMQNIE